MKPARLRHILDLCIVGAVVLGALYYLPRLRAAVHVIAETSATDPDWQPRYAGALFLLGFIPFAGGVAMLVPCLSLFRPPLGGARRLALALACITPLGLALYGTWIGPPHMGSAFLGIGLLFSLGVWLFALPPVFADITIMDVVAHIGRRHNGRRAL